MPGEGEQHRVRIGNTDVLYRLECLVAISFRETHHKFHYHAVQALSGTANICPQDRHFYEIVNNCILRN